MNADFIAFIPLSNWLRGFDRYAMRYSKARIGESTFKDAFYMLNEREPWTPGLEKARRLIAKVGTKGDRIVALRARLPVGEEGMRPNDVTGTGIGWRWPAADVPLHGLAWVNDAGALAPTHHEEVTAQAFQLESTATLAAWGACRPRSFSVLPVAKACQAKCAFCFSKASVSELERQQSASLEHVVALADEALRRGAERAVITGGGEPTLLAPGKLLALTRALAARFPKTLLITNGARLVLPALREAGLTTLALSRHGLDATHDARVMGLEVDSAARALEARELGLRVRSICVLQRDGIATVDDVKQYVERCAREGFHEVCFKELYVSSLSENPWAPSAVNQFCTKNQVPLAVVLEAMRAMEFTKIAELPWGSPVFERDGIRVAAYTEPSVGWERTNRTVRSWNVMADGTCLASLEDPRSEISL